MKSSEIASTAIGMHAIPNPNQCVKPAGTGIARRIGEKDPEVSGALVGTLFLAPNPKLIAGFLELRVGHVIGVKKQRFAFGEENSAEDRASLALRIGIEDINNMKVARGHQVSNVASGA